MNTATDSLDVQLAKSGSQPDAMTEQLTTITHTAPSSPDYALQALTDSGGFGFASADEGHSFLAVVANLQTRLAEVEEILEGLRAVASN